MRLLLLRADFVLVVYSVPLILVAAAVPVAADWVDVKPSGNAAAAGVDRAGIANVSM
jgi:hypothetical protein